MVKIICNVSLFKCDDYRLDKALYSEKLCEKCDSFAIEDAYHVILQCDYTNDIRRAMFNDFDDMYNDMGKSIINET